MSTKTKAGAQGKAAGVDTGISQGSAGATGRQGQSQTEIVGDINATEAYTLNMKRLVAGELDYDGFLRGNGARLIRNAEDHDGDLRQLSLQSLKNSVDLANRVANNAVDYQERIKYASLDREGRTSGNDEGLDKVMDAHAVGEKERTVRQGDALGVVTLAHLASDPFFQDLVEATAARVVAKQQKAKS